MPDGSLEAGMQLVYERKSCNTTLHRDLSGPTQRALLLTSPSPPQRPKPTPTTILSSSSGQPSPFQLPVPLETAGTVGVKGYLYLEAYGLIVTFHHPHMEMRPTLRGKQTGLFRLHILEQGLYLKHQRCKSTFQNTALRTTAMPSLSLFREFLIGQK